MLVEKSLLGEASVLDDVSVRDEAFMLGEVLVLGKAFVLGECLDALVLNDASVGELYVLRTTFASLVLVESPPVLVDLVVIKTSLFDADPSLDATGNVGLCCSPV